MGNSLRFPTALAFCALVAAAPLSTAIAKDFGLALTAIDYGPWADDSECPEGMALGSKEVMLRSMKPELRAEVEALEKKVGNSAAYVSRTLSERRGPNGVDVCANPTAVTDPIMPVGAATVSDGFDLDGGDTSKHCAHAEFKSPDGKSGIDNQVRRLTACIRNVRDGRINEGRTADILSGASVTLLRVTGVDNNENDPDVTVEIYKARDSFVKDGGGQPLPDATMRADKDAKAFKAVTKGKIVNGVLITEPVDARFAQSPAELFIKDARLQIKLTPDGFGDGKLGGYFDMASFWDVWARNPGGGAFTCPALYQSMKKLADGNKDASGQCTSLSVSFNVKVLRTFVVPPPTNAPQS